MTPLPPAPAAATFARCLALVQSFLAVLAGALAGLYAVTSYAVDAAAARSGTPYLLSGLGTMLGIVAAGLAALLRPSVREWVGDV